MTVKKYFDAISFSNGCFCCVFSEDLKYFHYTFDLFAEILW